MMTKKDIQKRILKDGKPLPLKKFKWDEKTKVFSSDVDDLVIDMRDVDGVIFKIAWRPTIRAGFNSTIQAGGNSTIDVGGNSTILAGWNSTIVAGGNSTIDAAGECSVTRITEQGLDVRKVEEGEYYTPSLEVTGIFKKEGKYYSYSEAEGEYLVADDIPGKVISEKKKAWKVELLDGTESFVVTDGEQYAHGSSIQDAKDSLIYKISDRDTSKYEGMSWDDGVSFEEAVKMYRAITGSCETETKKFAEEMEEKKDVYTVREVAEITKGQYGNDTFVEFFKTPEE